MIANEMKKISQTSLCEIYHINMTTTCDYSGSCRESDGMSLIFHHLCEKVH
jgi:hypothetical protein